MCTAPHIATQRPSKSDLQNKEVNYDGVFSDSEKILSQSIISEKSLEGFLQESKVYNNKLTLANIIIIALIFAGAKRLLAPL